MTSKNEIVVIRSRIEALTKRQQQVFWLLPRRCRGKPGNRSARAVSVQIYNTPLPSSQQLSSIHRILKSLLMDRLAFRGNIDTWYRVAVEGEEEKESHI